MDRFIKTIGVILVTVSLLISCKQKLPQAHGIVTFVSGKVTVIRGGKQEKAALNQRLVQGDSLKTANKAKATMQFGQTAVVRVLANTELVLKSLQKGGLINVENKEGRLFSKITKLTKSERYRVSTPTAVAGVRGTEFLSTVSKGKSRFLVKSGKVAVAKPVALTESEQSAPAEQQEEKIREHMAKSAEIVGAGKLAVVKVDKKSKVIEKVKVRKQSKVEKLNVKKVVASVAFVPEVEKATKPMLAKKQKAIEKKATVKKKSLDRKIQNIDNKSKPKVLLVLKDGSKMKGYIVSQSATMIQLDDGVDIMKVEKRDVVRRESVKNGG